MEEICSSETCIDFQRIKRSYITEDNTLHYNKLLSHFKFNLSLTVVTANLGEGLVSFWGHTERNSLSIYRGEKLFEQNFAGK
jgi:hypothetical protein